MATVSEPVGPEVIKAFKGTLDFYWRRGVMVVRSWPRTPSAPRAPAVQLAGQDWKDTSQALSALPLELRNQWTELMAGSAYTWKDAITSAAYSRAVSLAPPRPPNHNIPLAEHAMKVTLNAQGDSAAKTLNINSGSYITDNAKRFLVPFASVPYTHYRMLLAGNSNQAAQSILLQVADPATPATPVHAPGPDLTIPNIGAIYDSGWRSIDNIPAADSIWCVAFKGTNNTVDLAVGLWEITFTIL